MLLSIFLLCKNIYLQAGVSAASNPVPGSKSSRKKDDDQDTSPLLPLNNLKAQRNTDEVKLRVLKWNFAVPRDEFVEQLKEQMNTAGVNKTLMTNMFHADFKFHLKSIDSLSEVIHSESISNYSE